MKSINPLRSTIKSRTGMLHQVIVFAPDTINAKETKVKIGYGYMIWYKGKMNYTLFANNGEPLADDKFVAIELVHNQEKLVIVNGTIQ